MINYSEALAILQQQAPLNTTTLSINQALNYVASKKILSAVAIPPFSNSAMDGFAVSSYEVLSKNLPLKLDVKGSTAAGDAPALGNEEKAAAWEIMTGAQVPKAYDTVIKIEDVSISKSKGSDQQYPSEIQITQAISKNANIRHSGEDFKPGDLIIDSGTVVTPAHIMALATVGITEIPVYQKPKISVFNTGKEIVDHAGELLPGQIRNSNGPYLMTALKQATIEANYGGNIDDQAEIFEKKLSEAVHHHNIIISTGAVSMGRYDFIPQSLHRLGAKIYFHKVAIRPGKPILYARFPNGTHFFGLPGNPISAAVGLRFFVTPLLRAITGMPQEKALSVNLSNTHAKKAGFRFFYKGKVSVNEKGSLQAEILPGQQSFKIKPLLKANSWICLSENATGNESKATAFPFNPDQWQL